MLPCALDLKDQHDKIQSLSAELSHTKAKLKAACEEKSHEALLAEGSAILAALDNEEDEEEGEESEMILGKEKEAGMLTKLGSAALVILLVRF